MDEIFSPSDLRRLGAAATIAWGRDLPMPIDAFREALPRAVAVVCGDWRYGDVGFVGFGAIARSLQPLLRPFGCPISAFDPWLTDGELRAARVEPAKLEELLERCDVIFVLAAPTAENAALLSRPALERIRSDA